MIFNSCHGGNITSKIPLSLLLGKCVQKQLFDVEKIIETSYLVKKLFLLIFILGLDV